jgi:prepilin-type N-terminal cleavage/methylation domain-containing protein
MRTHDCETAKRRIGESAKARRPAFTLVEMIVVLTIMLILTVIAVAVAPRFQENQRVVKAADLISQWLLTAKQLALRNQVATGVRLNPDQANPFFVRELEYIQQPDDFYVQPGVDLINSPQVRRILIARSSSSSMPPPYYDLVDLEPVPPPPAPQPTVVADFSGGFGPTNPNLWPVQLGDFIEYQGTGLVHRIIGVSAMTLQLDPFGAPTSQIVTSIRQYRIIRSPRVLTGETPLQLPKDVAIDGTPKFSGDPFGFLPPVDILFSPSGGVLSPAGVGGKIIFWIRDTSKDPSAPGEQFLVVIQVRTGFIAVHPVDVYSGSPYRFANDARSSGL